MAKKNNTAVVLNTFTAAAAAAPVVKAPKKSAKRSAVVDAGPYEELNNMVAPTEAEGEAARDAEAAEAVVDDAVSAEVALRRGTVTEVSTVVEAFAEAVKPARLVAKREHAYSILGAARNANRRGTDVVAAIQDEIEAMPESIRLGAIKLAIKRDDGGDFRSILETCLPVEAAATAKKSARTSGTYSVVARGGKKGEGEVSMVYIPCSEVAKVGTRVERITDPVLMAKLIADGFKFVAVIAAH